MNDDEILEHAFKGDKEAVALAWDIVRIAHFFDDLVDKDKPVSDADIYECFWISMVRMPSNGFYRRYSRELIPVMAASILNWVAATDIERRKTRPLEAMEIAHVIRYSVADVLVLMATLIGGPKWGFQVAADLRLHCQREALKDYLKEHDYA